MRRRRHTLQVSTFPFLAVLLCAMGSLILLLLVLDRRAKVVARAKTRAHQVEMLAQQTKAEDDRQKQYEQKREALRQRLQQQESALHATVTDLQSKLSQKKSETAQERSRTQELKSRLASLREVLSREQEGFLQAQQQTAAVVSTKQRAWTEQEALSRQLVNLERALADVIAFRKRQSETYSVVPFLGKSGENRKPVYVECQSDQVIIHPERLAIKTERWDGSNPMKEVAEKLGERFKAITQGGNQKPYLLFLVRPTGIATYYHVMATLAPDKVDSGYELIEADWALDFGDKDGRPPTQPWVASTSQSLPPAVTTSAPRTPRSSTPVRGVPQGRFELSGSTEKQPGSAKASGNRQTGSDVAVNAQPGYGNAATGSGTGSTKGGTGYRGGPGIPNQVGVVAGSQQVGGVGTGYGNSRIELPTLGNSVNTGIAPNNADMGAGSIAAGSGNSSGNPPFRTGAPTIPGGTSPGGAPGPDRGISSIGQPNAQPFGPASGQAAGAPNSQFGSSGNSPTEGTGNRSLLLGLPGEVASGSRKPGDPTVPFADQPRESSGSGSGHSDRGLFPLPGANGGQRSGTGQLLTGDPAQPGVSGTRPQVPSIGGGVGGMQTNAANANGSGGPVSNQMLGTGNSPGGASQDSGGPQVFGKAKHDGFAQNSRENGERELQNKDVGGDGSSGSAMKRSSMARDQAGAAIQDSGTPYLPGNTGTGALDQNPRENGERGIEGTHDTKSMPPRTDAEAGPRPAMRADGPGAPDGVVQGSSQNTGTSGAGSGAASSGNGGGQGGDGDPGDGTSGSGIPGASDPLAHLKPRPKRSSLPPSFRVEANRDLPLLLECHGNEVVFTATGRSWQVGDLERNQATRAAFAETIQQWIARRQATVREGQTPYRPLLRFRVDPDGVRTYYAAYPVVEKLGVPMRRENVDTRPPATPLMRP